MDTYFVPLIGGPLHGTLVNPLSVEGALVQVAMPPRSSKETNLRHVYIRSNYGFVYHHDAFVNGDELDHVMES